MKSRLISSTVLLILLKGFLHSTRAFESILQLTAMPKEINVLNKLRETVSCALFLLFAVQFGIPSAAAQTFSAIANLPAARYGQTTTVLQDGTVLIGSQGPLLTGVQFRRVEIRIF